VRILVMVLLLFTFTNHCYADNPKSFDCEQWYEVGHGIMTLRQSGTPITKFSSTMSDPILFTMVEAAYSKPIFETKSEKDLSASEFANQMFLICTKAKRDYLNKGASR